MSNPSPPPTLALTTGDPAGIGPEIVRAAIERNLREGAFRLWVLGPACERPAGCPHGPGTSEPPPEEPVFWIETPGEGDWEPGRPQASAGRAALAALAEGVRWVREGGAQALVTAPVSKAALRLAGERVEGQTQLLERWSGAARVEMLACAADLRVVLLTRHLPLREALDAITTERVADALAFLHRELSDWGFPRPRIALAGWNPHAGEGGLFGTEENDLLRPAVEWARERGIEASGPWPADSVFVRAVEGAFDVVLALWHDQGFLPIKLLAPRRATTVLLGLPFVRVSPAHGTAFDIAGRGVADPGNLWVALEEACAWVQRRPSAVL